MIEMIDGGCVTKNSAAPYSGAALCRSCELRDDVARLATFKILSVRSCPLWRDFAANACMR